MKISSNTTYLLPFLVLLATTFCMTRYYTVEYANPRNNDLASFIGIAILISAIFYLVLRKLIRVVKAQYLKIVLCALPFILHNTLEATDDGHFILQIFFPLLFGCLLYLSFMLLDERYVVTLSDSTIHYTSLLGLSGEIPLQSITKLEQKKNMLSFFIKEFQLLDLTKKTCIAFCDENMDEYEVNFFSPIFKGNRVFETIISKANELGNLKIRQYEI